MKFSEQKEFTYDPNVFGREDVQLALKIHAEYIAAFSPRPEPQFFEVDHSTSEIDSLWHIPKSDRMPISRKIKIPAINQFEKPNWALTALGIRPQRRDKFWLANLHLQQFDYFPLRGDTVHWNGYRYMILNVVIPPETYWQQTGVWLGLVCECIIPSDGDAMPVTNPGVLIPAETVKVPKSGL